MEKEKRDSRNVNTFSDFNGALKRPWLHIRRIIFESAGIKSWKVGKLFF